MDLLEGFNKLKISQGDASSFVASKCNVAINCGFTANFPVPFMRPKIVNEMLAIHFADADITMAMYALKAGLTVGFLPYKFHQTNKMNKYEFCVESIAGNALNEYLSSHPHAKVNFKRQMYLYELIEVDGVASKDSFSDGIVYSEVGSVNIGTAVYEAKDTAFAPLEQLGQAQSIASNLVLGQLKFGLPSEKCCVAVMSTNGQLYQFGFVTLLYPSFPVLHLTSHVIDTADAQGIKTAAAHLHTFREFCRSQDALLREGNRKMASGEIYVALDESRFYQKPMSKLFERCTTLYQSVRNLYEIFQRLYDHEVDVAVLPVAIKSGELDDRKYLSNDALVFPKLSDEFQMGLPMDNTDFANYLTALKDAHKKMHNAGVVHLDGYPSNILWKKTEECIMIKFVDFDVASFLNSPFDSEIREHMMGPTYASSYYYWQETEKATVKHDAWFVFIYSQMTSEERTTSFEAGLRKDIHGVVSNYWGVVERLRLAENVVTEFNDWFDTNWNL